MKHCRTSGGICPIPLGVVPIKYLGVPLISTRVKANGCSVLQDRILGRIQSWSPKTLCYGGRAELILSVSIQLYWSQILIIPQKVLRGIESKLMAFLWSGFELDLKCARVKWDHVWLP